MRTAAFAYYRSNDFKHETLHYDYEQGLVFVCSYKVRVCKVLCRKMASAG